MQLSPRQAWIYGGLTVGTLDLLDAFIFFGARGARPGSILQGIASGLLGPSSFQGGAGTAALGLGLHYLIAFTIVMVYFLASTRLPVLTRRAVVCGLAYGVVAYAVMNQVILPLSAVRAGAFSLPVFANGLLIHMFGVGLPSALFARAARR